MCAKNRRRPPQGRSPCVNLNVGRFARPTHLLALTNAWGNAAARLRQPRTNAILVVWCPNVSTHIRVQRKTFTFVWWRSWIDSPRLICSHYKSDKCPYNLYKRLLTEKDFSTNSILWHKSLVFSSTLKSICHRRFGVSRPTVMSLWVYWRNSTSTLVLGSRPENWVLHSSLGIGVQVFKLNSFFLIIS